MFYNPKNILVTGGCGFIGSNFILYMLEKHKDILIVNVDTLNYCSTKDLCIDKERYVFSHSDINDYETNKTMLEKYEIDTVVHFAAQSHVDNSFKNSIQFTRDNVLGTHTLLEACREYGKIKRFVHISTDEVYGEVDMENDGCVEKGVLNPTNPYAATKAAAEFLVRSYYHSFKLPVVITRGNNVYGPRQYPEKVIPSFINNLLKNDSCKIHGKGLSRRNFIHVNDVSTALETILNKGKINDIYNIGTCNEYNVLEVLEKLVLLIKDDTNYLQYADFVEDRLFNDFRYCINNTKLKKLGWSERIEFTEGLKSTIEWYKNNSNIF
jgi:UDP-glucose 4,6-dehydratase